MKLLWALLERTRDLTWFIIATFLIYTFIFTPMAKADEMETFHKLLALDCVKALNSDIKHLSQVEKAGLVDHSLIEELPKDLENRVIKLKLRLYTLDMKRLVRGSRVVDGFYCGVNIGLGLVYIDRELLQVANFVRSGLPKGTEL